MALLERLEGRKNNEQVPGIKAGERVKTSLPPRSDPFQALKSKIHKRVVDELGAAEIERRQLEESVTRIADFTMDEEPIPVPRFERSRIISEVVDEVLGYGPLEPLLKDETISDILVNGPFRVFVERAGKLELSDVTFRDERHLMRIIDKIVSAVGRRVDECLAAAGELRLARVARLEARVGGLVREHGELRLELADLLFEQFVARIGREYGDVEELAMAAHDVERLRADGARGA